MIRAAECHNPGWYSDLYWEHDPRPGLKRDRCERALDRLRQGEDQPYWNSRMYGAVPHLYSYDTLFRTAILQRLLHGYEHQGRPIEPVPEVRDFFEPSELETTMETEYTLAV